MSACSSIGACDDARSRPSNSVTDVCALPLTGSAQTSVTEFEGLERASSQAPIELQADMRPITPDYFRVMQIPLIAGRGFTEADDDQAAPVAIVDERIAKTVYKDVDPIGRRVRPPVAGQPW